MNILQETTFIRRILRLCEALAMLMLTGCIVGPNHVPPDTVVSMTWHSQLQDGLSAEQMDPQVLASWWAALGDPGLSSLMERAVTGNLDLKNAQARIREARARRAVAKGTLFPTLDATGSATASRIDTDTGTDTSREVYTANFDAGWELDIFGGIRRSVEAAEAGLQASREDLRDVLVSLLAEAALNYVEVRTFQARLAAAEASMDTQNETYQLTLWRHQAGLDDQLAVQQARYNLENTRSQIPTLRTGLEEAMNRIAVLLGEQPGQVHGDLEKPEPIPVPPSKIAVGVPADMVRRRPDVRRAERELAAQTARVGVATADLYPKLTLNGSVGMETLNAPYSSNTRTVGAGPRISWAIFNPTVRPSIDVQSALQEQALIRYEAAVLGSLEDVENAIVAYAQEKQRRESLRQATEAAQAAAELAQFKYQAGLADFSNVLDAERSLLSFQDQLHQSNGTVTSNVIRLYKALGGGWASTAAAPTTPETAEQL